MKQIILLFGFIAISLFSSAQGDSTLSPSERFRLFPQAKFLLSDSVTYFTKADLKKNKPAMMMVFNPECEHCQHETEELTKNIDKFKGIQIVMSSMVTITEIKGFIEKYQLSKYDNIIVGKDVSYFLPAYYQFNNLPFLAFYDKKQKLISTFSGSMKIDDILKEFK
ncbi:MAG: redoxin domain-containing protein [Chitinophagaceae bacterium]